MFPGKHQTTRLAIFKIMPRTLMFTCSGRLSFTLTTASSRNYILCVKQFNRFSKVSSNTFFWQGNQLSALWSSDSILHSGILTLTESLKNTEIQKEKFPPPHSTTTSSTERTLASIITSPHPHCCIRRPTRRKKWINSSHSNRKSSTFKSEQKLSADRR